MTSSGRPGTTSKLLPIALALLVAVIACSPVADCRSTRLPPGYLGEKQSRQILDKTLTIRLAPETAHLGEDETRVIEILIEVGKIMQTLYEESKHRGALEAHEKLVALHSELGEPRSTQNLLDLYRLYKGPVGRRLDNSVAPFLPVEDKVPGRNVYPWGVEKREIEAFLSEFPQEKGAILHPRTVVREATIENISMDLERFQRQSGVLAHLHHDFASRMSRLRDQLSAGENVPRFYVVPYSIAYADRIVEASGLLMAAASTIESADPEFARYLRHRAVDLLRDDYEAGDAAWVTGNFGNINAQIGSYETYDDELYGVKTFFSASILVRNRAKTSTVQAAVSSLQDFEDALPYEPHKPVRDAIPIGAYDVVADFGQARGTNTATILPNEAYITRKYGRTILIRDNILSHPDIFTIRKASFEAVLEDEFHDSYQSYGDFFRTLWHEIGHYLGPDLTNDGRTLDIALEEDASILEELKSDLVALFVAKRLYKNQYFSRSRLLALQASGIRRVLLKNKPSKTQVYRTMELMQMNYFLEKGLLAFDKRARRLRIDYAQYHPTVESMLREVLALQQSGDKKAADRFIESYSAWDEDVHGVLARAMKSSETYRFVLVRYGALGE